jgi:hypothetical protein
MTCCSRKTLYALEMFAARTRELYSLLAGLGCCLQTVNNSHVSTDMAELASWRLFGHATRYWLSSRLGFLDRVWRTSGAGISSQHRQDNEGPNSRDKRVPAIEGRSMHAQRANTDQSSRDMLLN